MAKNKKSPAVIRGCPEVQENFALRENIKKEKFLQGLYSEIIYKKKINDVDKFYKNKNLDCLLNRENNYAYLNKNI